VALPEVPLLAVLPGTGGLTRVTDKRKVRRDLADVFCSTEEGVKGKRAQDWRLVDEVVPNSKFDEKVAERAEFAAKPPKPAMGEGIALTPLERTLRRGRVGHLFAGRGDGRSRRAQGDATINRARTAPRRLPTWPPSQAQGAQAWTCALARELDDAILHLRLNERNSG
jgi:benzoyl-CoA-dihydrodiol lyase